MLQKEIPEYGMETSEEVQNSTISGESDVDTFLGSTRTSFRTMPRGGHNTEQLPLQLNALGPAKTSYSNKRLTTVVERCHNVVR
jgi:hypothetical protein